MKKFKGSKQLFFGISMVLSLMLLFNACTKSNGNTATSEASPSTSSPATSSSPTGGADDNPYAEHLDITWMGYNWSGFLWENDIPTKKLIEDKFNVTITNAPVDMNSPEQFNLYIADGNTADYMVHYEGIPQKIEDGIFKELDLQDVRKKMPNWFRVLESMIPYEVIEAKSQVNGKYYAVPWANYNSFVPSVGGVRQDWLDSLGIEAPKTLEEFHEMLRKFTFDDPDKNGKNDTFGMSEIGTYMYGAFGIGGQSFNAHNLNHFLDDSGKVNAAAISQNKKEMLQTLAAWYKEGIIDPEFLTDDRTKKWVKWEEGRFGYLTDQPYWWMPSTPNNISDMPSKNNPSAKIKLIEPFSGPYGQGTTGVLYAPMMDSFRIGKDTSEAKMDRIFAINDYLVADDDFNARIYFGEEGVHYTRSAAGTIQPTEEYKEVANIAKAGLSTYYSFKPEDFNYAKKFYLDAEKDAPIYELAMSLKLYPSDVNFKFVGKNESLVKYTTDLSTIVSEFDVQVISGQADLDTEWDKFKERYLKAGGQEVLDEYQSLYEASK